MKKGLASTDAATKEAAGKLAAAVQPKIDDAVAQAKSALDEGDKWTAFKQYMQVGQCFDGFNLPPEIKAQRQALAKDPQVRHAIQASKDLEKAKKILNANPSPTPVVRHSLVSMLKQVTKDAPGTEFAKEAEDLLAKVGPEEK